MQLPASNAPRKWHVIAAAVAVTLTLFGIALVPPGTLPYPPKSDYSDAQVSHWPNAYFFRQSVLETHTWPFWNPMRMLGQPFSANPLSEVWYPPQWLALIFPPTTHLNLLIYLHLLWLGLGVAVWARAEHRPMLAAAFMTFAWGLNPKLVGHLGAGHLDIVYALAWVPWVMWATLRLVAQPNVRQGSLLGSALALMTLADIRIVAYFLPVALVYGYVQWRDSRSPVRRLGLAAALALVILVLLTAVQTIPLVAIGPYLTRAGLTPQEAAELSLPPHYLLGLILPDVGGRHEWMTALGLPVLVLAAFALGDSRGRERALILWGIVLIALAWSLGSFGPLYLPLVKLLPVLTWLRIPARGWFVVAFCLAVLSGQGLEYLLRDGVGRFGKLVAAALAFAGLMMLAAMLVVPRLPGVLAGVGASLLGTGGGLALMGIQPGARRVERPGRGRLLGGGLLLVTLTLSLVGLDETLVIPRSLADIESADRAIISQLDPGCRTVYSPTFQLIGPATIASGIVTLQGVDPFQLRGSAQFIAAAAGAGLRGYSVIAPPMPPGEPDLAGVQPRLALLREAGVCAVVSSLPLDMPGLARSGQEGAVAIYRLAQTSQPSTADDDQHSQFYWQPLVFGVKQMSTQICLSKDSKLPGTLIVPQSWAPGWQAWIDAQPVPVASLSDGAFISVEIPAPGCHSIALAYRPQADLVGVAVSAMVCLGLIGGWIFARQRSRHV